jgi:transposase
MDRIRPPLPLKIWAATPAAAQALILAQRERIRELEARLGQISANSSCPPSSDPPQVPVRPQAPPSGRMRGGQPGHRGTFRPLLPVDAVDEIVPVGPEHCWHGQQPFSRTEVPSRARVWRHQVVELLPLAVWVTEYQMVARRCPACGKPSRADLPAGVRRRRSGPG